MSEAIRFYRELPRVASAPEVVIFNRTLPDRWAITPPKGLDAETKHIVELWSSETVRQRDFRDEFSARYGATVATIPWSSTPPTQLEGLADLATSAQGVPWERLGIS
jgi:hypothetical protein